MSLLALGLATPVLTIAGTQGQITINGQYAALNGNVVVALDGSISGATGFYAVLTGMSGALVTQIQSAAGVLSLNNATGLLTLQGGTALNNYVGVSTAGTTISVTGSPFPTLVGVGFTGGGQIVGALANTLSISAQLVTPSGLYMGRTGDYTASGAASVAQLTAASGGLQSIVTTLTTTVASTGQQAWTAANNNGINLSGALTQSGITLVALNLATSGALNAAAGLLSGYFANAGGSNLVYTTGTQTIQGVKTFAGANLIITGGNLGVGTIAPSEGVHVSGRNLRIDGSGLLAGPLDGVADLALYRAGVGVSVYKSLTAGAQSTIRFQSSTDSFSTLGRVNASNQIIAGDQAGDFVVQSNRLLLIGAGGITMTVSSNSMVGIGTLVPAYTLSVNGGAGVSGTMLARSYQSAMSGVPIPVAAGATGLYNVDFTNSAALQTVTITGSTLFSGVNYVNGGAATVRVNVSGSSSIPVSFSSTWNWVSTMPTGLATGRFAILTLNTFTANDTGVCVAWAVAP